MAVSLQTRLTRFRDHLERAPLVDTRVHTSFNTQPMLHGYTADFEKAAPVGSRLFEEWVGVTAAYIIERYEVRFNALIGIDSDTIDLAEAVAETVAHKTGRMVMSIRTEKSKKDPPTYRLEKQWGQAVLRTMPVETALILDDVGSTGASSAAVADILRDEGVPDIRVLYSMQYSLTIPELDDREVPYASLYTETIETYTPADCQAYGLCARGIPLDHRVTDRATS